MHHTMQAHITEEIIYVDSHFQRRNHDGHPQTVPLLIFHQTRYEFEPIRSLWLQKNKFEQVIKKTLQWHHMSIINHLKWPESWLFVEKLVQANNKVFIKCFHYSYFSGEPCSGFVTHRASNTESISMAWHHHEKISLTHLLLVAHICVSESGQHWFR